MVIIRPAKDKKRKKEKSDSRQKYLISNAMAVDLAVVPGLIDELRWETFRFPHSPKEYATFRYSRLTERIPPTLALLAAAPI